VVSSFGRLDNGVQGAFHLGSGETENCVFVVENGRSM